MRGNYLRERLGITVLIVAAMILSCSLFADEAKAAPGRPKVALVLEGGGALGLAHVGVIQALEREGIPIDMVVGTSMGSIIGGLYALGYDGDQLESIVREADWAELFSEEQSINGESSDERENRSRFAFSLSFDTSGVQFGNGLLSGRKVLELIDCLAVIQPRLADFDSLPRRFRAIATDIESGEAIVLDHGPIADAMRASMSIPGVFSPYEFAGHRLVDGGLVQNLPVETARTLGADIIVAVDLRSGTNLPPKAAQSHIDILSRSLDILMRQNVDRSIPKADYVVTIDLRGYSSPDFGKADEILALGKAAGLNAAHTIEALRSRLGVAEGSSAVRPQPSMPRIANVIVVGGSKAEQALAKGIFSPILDTVPDRRQLEGMTDKLDSSGLFESIRLGLSSMDGRPTLVVGLESRGSRGNQFGVNASYESTYSTAVSTSNRALSANILFNDFGSPSDKLELSGEILDAPGIGARYTKHIASGITADGHAQFERDSATYLTADTLGYRYQTMATEAGADIGYEPLLSHKFSLGWEYAWIRESYIPDSYADASIERASIFHAGFAIDKLDSPIFPMDGVSSDAEYSMALTALGSERTFSTLVWRGSTYASFHSPFAFGLVWKAGTDFSSLVEGANSAPYYYMPSLDDRLLFPGLVAPDGYVGSHVLAAGISATTNLARLSRSIKVPAFLVCQASAGAALRDFSDYDELRSFAGWNWSGAVGLGVRINDGFGVSLKGGVARTAWASVRPFLSFDFGALGVRKKR